MQPHLLSVETAVYDILTDDDAHSARVKVFYVNYESQRCILKTVIEHIRRIDCDGKCENVRISTTRVLDGLKMHTDGENGVGLPKPPGIITIDTDQE